MRKKILLGMFALFIGLGSALAVTAPVADCGVSACGGGNVKCCSDNAGNTFWKR